MAEVTSGKNLTVIVLNEEEADALAIALSMVFGTEDLDEVYSTALMYYKTEPVGETGNVSSELAWETN